MTGYKQTKTKKPREGLFKEQGDLACFQADAMYCPYITVEDLEGQERYLKALILLHELEDLGFVQSKLLYAGSNEDGSGNYVRHFRLVGSDKLPRSRQ